MDLRDLEHNSDLPEADQLWAVVYLSWATVQFDEAALIKLNNSNQVNNKLHGITGLLVHKRGMFLQYIEGKQAAVMELMKKLYDDPRHEGITVLHSGMRRTRRFPEWHMAFSNIVPSGITQSLNSSEDIEAVNLMRTFLHDLA
jgi:hypothetical protein